MGDCEGTSEEQPQKIDDAQKGRTREVPARHFVMRKRTWKSTTFWVTVLAAVILTSIVVRILAPSSTALSAVEGAILQTVVGLCGAIILAYVGGNKAVDFKHGPEQEPNQEGQ